jgi:acyl-CoA synthetase (NDP forming)
MNGQCKGNIDTFFNAHSIAAIGSLKGGIFGGACLIENLHNFGFQGEVYPVNPSYNEVLGLKVYPSISEVPRAVELAIISASARAVPGIIKECVEKGVKAAVIASDGFAERDKAGAELQQEIVNIAKPAGMCLIGPNTIGVVNVRKGIITDLYMLGYHKIKQGSIALGSQTGLIGAQAFPFEDTQYGISKICDFGNKCDVDEVDYLSYLKNDPDTKVISLYLDDIRSGRRFLDIAKEISAQKPVLIYKGGRAKESKKAVASHTGSIAGEYTVYASAFKQTGIIPLTSFDDIFEIPKIFATQPLPKGNRIAIITLTGAGGIAAVDNIFEQGLSLASLSSQTLKKLAEIDPSLSSNPVDLGPTIVMKDTFSLYRETLRLFLRDENVDCITVHFFGSQLAPPEIFVNSLKELNPTKPIASWVYGTKKSAIEEISLALENSGFPVFSTLETAVRALGAMVRYSQWLAKNKS